VVEVLHYLIKDFSHEMVPRLVSVDRSAGSWLHSMEESSGFYDLWRGDRSWDITQPPAPRPALAWYCSIKSLLTRNQPLVPHFRAGPLWQAFTTIERFLETEGILSASVDPEDDLFGRRIAAMTKPACKRLDALMKPLIEAVAAPDLLSFLKSIAKTKVNLNRLRAALLGNMLILGGYELGVGSLVICPRKTGPGSGGQVTPANTSTVNGSSFRGSGHVQAPALDGGAPRVRGTGRSPAD
jgi:hypothetical protein